MCFNKLNGGCSCCLICHGFDSSLLADIQTVQELTDILVPDSGGPLDLGSRLGNILNIVALKDQLILHGLAALNSNTLLHLDTSDVLLTQKVSDLNEGALLADGAVNGEMGIYGSHLVLESLKKKNLSYEDKSFKMLHKIEIMYPYKICLSVEVKKTSSRTIYFSP